MGDVVKLKIQNILSRVDLFLSNNLIGSILKVAETKTGVKRSFIAIGKSKNKLLFFQLLVFFD
jgi:hypothetical protein